MTGLLLPITRARRRATDEAPWVIAGCVAVAALSAYTAVHGFSSVHEFDRVAVPVLLLPVVLWLVGSERYDRSLVALMLYLGLLDGPVKLTSGSSAGTLGRDAVLYAIVVGAVLRMILKRPSLGVPPIGICVALWIAVCLMQVANPGGGSTFHSIAALRPHLEFVPLFAFGYVLLRSKKWLVNFCALLVFVAAVNGAVSVIQSGLSPQQLAGWGPGYANIELGNAVTGVAQTFVANGKEFVRPLGLGGEVGFAGLLCAVSIPAALVLLLSVTSVSRRVLVLLALAPIVAGVVTSQSRLVILMSVVGVFVFLALTINSRQGLVALVLVLILAGGGTWAASQYFASHANRFNAHANSESLQTRQEALNLTGKYIKEFPLGAGLGSVGPAAGSSVGGLSHSGLNGENEFNFLLIETGIPGLVVIVLITLITLRYGVSLRKQSDAQLHYLLACFTAIYVALMAAWFAGGVTSDSPGAPLFWLITGVVAFWYQEQKTDRARGPLAETTAQ